MRAALYAATAASMSATEISCTLPNVAAPATRNVLQDASIAAVTISRTQGVRRMGLTRSRPNYSAIKAGKIRPNPLAFLAVGRKNDVHERDFIASANGRQTKTARPGARRDSAQTFQHSH